MKKIIITIAAATVLLAGCSQKEELNPEVSQAARLELRGQCCDETRISIGELSEGVYPLTWTAGDQIGLFTTSGECFENASATLHKSSAGQKSGIFVLDEAKAISENLNGFVYYPYNGWTSYSDGMYSAFVYLDQTMTKAGDSSNIGQYAVAYSGETSFPATQADGTQPSVNFSLTHVTAYVKLVVSSTEFASYKLAGASIYCKDKVLAGDIKVNPTTGAYKALVKRQYVTVKVEEPSEMSAPQELWLTTIPADLTGSKCYVTLEFTNGTENVTIPVELDGKKLEAGKVNTITLSNVSKSNVTWAWYEPVDTRYMAGTWCYGENNTYLLDGDETKTTIDARARGYFCGCEEPKYARVLFVTNVGNGAWIVNGDSVKTNNQNSEAEAKYLELKPDYKIDIEWAKSSYAGCWGKIAICNASKKMIWSFNVWRVPDGIGEHKYKNGVMMDRNLGNGMAPDYDHWAQVGMYCQWGRPFGFSWGSTTYTLSSGSGVTSLLVSAQNPEKFYHMDGGNVKNENDWLRHSTVFQNRRARKDDLWGNPNTTGPGGSPEKGEKSILDPCPKGWMVASPTMLKEVVANKESEFKLGTFIQNGVTTLPMRWMIYKVDENTTAYYPFSGLKWCSNGGNPGNCVGDIMSYISNSPYEPSTGSAVGAAGFSYRDGTGWGESIANAMGSSVRCMKDDKGR